MSKMSRADSISFKVLVIVPLTRFQGASHPERFPLRFTVSSPNVSFRQACMTSGATG